MAEFSNYMSPGRKGYLIGIGGVSMSSLAEVLLVLHAAEHLPHPVAAQAGQAAEGLDLLFHRGFPRMFCKVATLVSSSAASPTSWRRKRSMVGASCTARSVLMSAPGV